VSTLPSANLFPSWKEEVNRRVADHKSRKAAPAQGSETLNPTHGAQSGRAARAAARVAARYSNAPSYSQMLAEEVRAAMHAAQAAKTAAEDAHAAVQMVLAGIEAAASTETASDLRIVTQRPAQTELPAEENLRETSVAAACAATAQAESDPFAGMRLAPLDADAHGRAAAGFTQADPAEEPEPIAANLIQFPREIVATRRLRPRRIEGPLAALETAPQLSIFEVDAAYVSTLPAAPAVGEPVAPDWMRSGWTAAETETRSRKEPAEATAAQSAASSIVDLAPVSRRAMAIVVDGALTLAGFAVLMALATASGLVMHNMRAFEVVCAVVVLLVYGGYQALFSSMTKSTPGMWYAGIGLCTTDGYIPNRAQRCRRLAALPLSVMPLGLGLAWSLFDEDRLTWHDRLSGTYMRLR
jgi:uncharacterized RDD family membrane protein YckC